MPDIHSNLKTTLEYFYHWETTTPDNVFLKQPFDNQWKDITWAEAGRQIRCMVTALQNMGLEKGSHIGIYSKNCYHWILADLAITMGGYVSTPFYPNLTAEPLNQVLKESDAKVLFAGKLDEWDKVKSGVPKDVKIISFPHYPGNAKVKEGENWDNLVAANKPFSDSPVPDPDGLWTVLFTSGTTGTPKGVMLQHKAPALIMRNEDLHGELGMFKGEEHRFFSYLPLNHIAERAAVETGCIRTGGTISFAESLDTFAKNLQETQPTLFVAVPRIWTKFQHAILEKLPQKKLDLLLKLPGINSMIKNKVRKGLGLTYARVILTGAAPIPDSLKDWYARLGIVLREAYGMTETCGAFTIMPFDKVKRGSVGKPVTNSKMKLDPETGEILMQAPWIMTGYYKDPEKTAMVLRDGWIHTGDQGEADEEGFLKITGRISDTFKSAKGKFIVPAPIEWKFAKNEFIEQISIVGLSISQPIALIVLSDMGKGSQPDDVTRSLQKSLLEVNQSLVNYQKVSTIVIIQEDWTIENNLLTPTLKIRRQAINERYGKHYRTWHEHQEEIIWEKIPDYILQQTLTS